MSKKRMKEIGSERSASWCPFGRGELGGAGGLKLFGQCPYGNNTFQKGASLIAPAYLFHELSCPNLKPNFFLHFENIDQRLWEQGSKFIWEAQHARR